MVNRKTKLGIGLILGAVTGFLAGLFASEKPGKAIREKTKENYEAILTLFRDKNIDTKIKKIFGEFKIEFKTTVEDAKDDMAKKLFELSQTSKTIDRKKYSSLLSNTINGVKKKHKLPQKSVTQLKKYLESDIKKFQNTTKKQSQKRSPLK